MSSSALYNNVFQSKISNVQNVGDSSAVCSTTGDWSFKNATATATNVFISNAGNVGIGTTTPLNLKLDVAGNVHTSGSYILDNDNSLYWGFADGSTSIKGNSSTDTLTFSTLGTERMRIDVSGRLIVSNGASITPSAGTGALYGIAGDGLALTGNGSSTDIRFFNKNAATAGYVSTGATTITTTSDERIKENLEPIESALDKVGKLRTVTGNYKSDPSRNVAFFVAQDFDGVFNQALDKTDPDCWGVNYNWVMPLLAAAIKEQQAMIESMKAEIEALKASAVLAPSEGA